MMTKFFLSLIIVAAFAVAVSAQATPFKDENGKYGYKNAHGAVLIAPQFAAARPFSTDGLAAVNVGGTTKGDDRAKYHCYLTASELIKLDFLPQTDRKKAEVNIRKFASGETEKTVANLKGDAKVKRYIENGEVFSSLNMFEAAREQYSEALTVKQGSDKEKAVAQYYIGETLAKLGKNEEAKKAYMNVSAANPTYSRSAQERIKELEAKKPPTNKPL